jgi:hypothetical protein
MFSNVEFRGKAMGLPYPFIFHSCLVTRYSCVNNFYYSLWTCGEACYLYEVRYKIFTLSNKMTIVIRSFFIFNAVFANKNGKCRIEIFRRNWRIFCQYNLYSDLIKCLKNLRCLIMSLRFVWVNNKTLFLKMTVVDRY